MNFCHLHLHTEYSMLDGYGKAEEYVKQAQRFGYKYLGCTDHGNIDGLIHFQKVCLDNKIIPILGCEAYLVEDSGSKGKNGHITFWIKNNLGFKNLCSMLSIANLDNYYYRPRITFENLRQHYKGLVIGTACLGSFVNLPNGEKFFRELKKLAKNDLYAEVMAIDIEHQPAHNRKIIELAQHTNTKIILTNDCHYAKRSEAVYQEMMLAIARKAKWNDPKRWKFDSNDNYLLSPKEFLTKAQRSFLKEDYLINTLEVAEKCKNFRIRKRKISLPKIKTVNTDEKIFLWNLCFSQLTIKFGQNKIYYDRFKTEYDLIVSKEFERYLLIVWELCKWCRENDIIVGPRGSVGGSLIAYLLKITMVDPIKHNLLFERFISQDRVDYPDIDLDFDPRRIDLIKQHLRDIYGYDNVAAVSNFNTYKTKGSIQDVARVFNIPQEEVNARTKLIVDDVSLTEEEILEGFAKTDEGAQFFTRYPKVLRFSKKLLNRVRNYSQHAAAVIVSPEAIDTSGRCNLIKGKVETRINWDKYDAEFVGFVKLDVLKLNQLAVIGEALRMIKENYNIDIVLEDIDLNDEKVLAEINDNNNIGIFQLNTYHMRDLISKIKIKSFETIVHLNALARPGPNDSGMTAEYIRRQNGAQWEKLNPEYENLTEDTFGLLIFQEQIMAVISKIAGLPYSTADRIRKIISKKRKQQLFTQYEKTFKDGCKNTKFFSEKEAIDFWDGLQSWANYGFPKAHSVGYSMISFWCAYLKLYYPTEFFCATLTYSGDEVKNDIVQEAYLSGLGTLPPKVGISHAINWIAKNDCLHAPFSEIDGFGPNKAEKAANPPKQDKVKGKLKFAILKQNILPKHSGEIGKLLESINAYDQNSTELSKEAKALFKFEFKSKPENLFNHLHTKPDREDLKLILRGNSKSIKKYVKKVISENNKNIRVDRTCVLCKLSEVDSIPISPTSGKYNVMLIGEAPGKIENLREKPFVGKSGKLLWQTLKPFKREYFHVTNVVKCWPNSVRTPNSEQIKICSEKYLSEEIKLIDPRLILVIGNKAMSFFTGREKGIAANSGKIIWNDDLDAWIVWLIHPAAALRDQENLQLFKQGIKSFKKILRTMLQL